MKYYVICKDCTSRIFDNAESFKNWMSNHKEEVAFYRVGR